tara:strand:- start:1504 stop:2772 length:1269 start_codon:yes stop_codon:yes gene_type:complete
MIEHLYINDILSVESVPIDEIVKEIKTPFYVYSHEKIQNNYFDLVSGLNKKRCSIFYSVKANSNLAIIKTISNLGAGMDVVSLGEYKRVKKSGVNSNKIIFSGVGKTKKELQKVILGGIKQINIESEEELSLLNKTASELNKIVPISFRVNPDVDAETHEKISTGKAENKFGISWNNVRDIYFNASKLTNVRIVGIDFHIGSQLTNLAPFRKAFEKVADMVKILKSDGHNIQSIDIGGGLGIKYSNKIIVPSYVDYGNLIEEVFGDLDCKIEIEPGRSLVGNAGFLVCSVIYLKKGDNKNFLIVDGAMNDLIRPSLYNAFHDVICVDRRHNKRKKMFLDVVGPVCETGDFIGISRELPELKNNELIAICSAGAYGAVMASEYNTRPLVPEVMVKKDNFSVIRKRPSIKSIIERDIVPEWINN